MVGGGGGEGGQIKFGLTAKKQKQTAKRKWPKENGRVVVVVRHEKFSIFLQLAAGNMPPPKQVEWRQMGRTFPPFCDIMIHPVIH